MQLTDKEHEKIMKRGKGVFEMLEVYDRTRKWPIGKKRVDITLSKRLIEKLNKIKKRTGKSVSGIIEEAVLNIRIP